VVRYRKKEAVSSGLPAKLRKPLQKVTPWRKHREKPRRTNHENSVGLPKQTLVQR
jgi:hypothetical protein